MTANFSSANGAPWYDTAWPNRKLITVNHTKVSGSSSLNNFPMLFSVTDSSLGVGAKPDGSDILFTASDGLTKLNHEMEQYDPGSGTLVAWVQVPALSPTTDTAIYVYYGNSSASNQQNRAAVWGSSYKGVWHLAETSGTTTADSTANALAGIKKTASAPSPSAGETGGAQFFKNYVTSGESAYVNLGAPAVINTLQAPLTISAWFNIYSETTTGRKTLFGQYGAYNISSLIKLLRVDGNTLKYFMTGNYSNGVQSCTFPTAITFQNWHHVVVNVTGTIYAPSVSITVDGVKQSCSGIGQFNSPVDATASTYIGSNQYQGISEGMWGTIDEVRVSDTSRSDGWNATEFANQNSPSTFYSIGTQQNGPGPGPVTITSVPGGLSLTVDGVPCTAPCSFPWTPGSAHIIAVTQPAQTGTGAQYQFLNWSDGGAQSHSITAPVIAATYTANFNAQYLLQTVVSPAGAGTIGPRSGWFSGGTVVAVSAAAGSGHQFTGFTGALNGAAAGQNLIMTGPQTVTANFATVNTVPMTVTSAPAGLLLTVDGASCLSPCTYNWPIGSSHTLAVVASSQVGSDGLPYTFAYCPTAVRNRTPSQRAQ